MVHTKQTNLIIQSYKTPGVPLNRILPSPIVLFHLPIDVPHNLISRLLVLHRNLFLTIIR